MSEDEYGTGIRPRIADGLPNDVNLLILDHLYPVSLIRAAYAGYPVPAEWVRRALHTYLWKRVLVVQFDSVKARIREGENIFLIGYGLERLTCGIFEEADEAPTIKLLLGWLPGERFLERNVRMKVYREFRKATNRSSALLECNS
ncbi:uncharacterized protein BBA_10073 [Beauveria bassiana ARSEF 2860]|uniref:Uncharacterized protein n=1 Tax=Beauveria bassiana (strain ARSEF 2860) TaxID=655819 RepID=J4KKS7_BEAB2|nr:uncharacterized protein BBA_10073 [Beauveria bassiana ARSEF 2860]EJP60974.1 hypothetical protein BBA_10073 [Beauveria bassiana ARSEF 2860]